MLINEVAKATGLSKDTVRFYTKLGLVNATEKKAGSRFYSDYDESVLELLSEIKLAKSAGFTLNEIRISISEWKAGNLSNTDAINLFTRKLEEVGRKKAELIEIEKILRAKIETFSRESEG